MENQGVIYKIKSVNIIKNIFSYIRDNKIQLKLFIYSKYFQSKLNLKYIDAKEKYLKNLGFNINEYLFIEEEKYEYNLLNKKYKDFLLKKKIKNKERFEEIIFEILENKQINGTNKGNETYVNIDSPLFIIILVLTNFENNYTIFISQLHIYKYNLLNKYIELFDNLNSYDINYLSLFYSSYNDEIKYLKQLNIDYNKIKKLKVKAYEIKNLGFLEYII